MEYSIKVIFDDEENEIIGFEVYIDGLKIKFVADINEAIKCIKNYIKERNRDILPPL